ncbi:hypothetical protein [Ammoniphilus sp. 3BR4]
MRTSTASREVRLSWSRRPEGAREIKRKQEMKKREWKLSRTDSRNGW